MSDAVMSSTVGRTQRRRPGVTGARLLDGRRLEVEWDCGTRDLLWGYWLRIQAADAGLFEGTARAWTDGANFHPQQDVAGGTERLIRAEPRAGGGLVVAWSDGVEHHFDPARLARALEGDPADNVEKVAWDGSQQWRSWPYESLVEQSDQYELLDFLEEFLRYGVVFVDGAPREAEALDRLASAIARLDPSHLGERFHIRLKSDSEHIGEVLAGIPLHIDLVYRQNPPAIQALHALQQVGAGGENEFVDVYHLARQLSYDDVRLLSTTSVDFVASSTRVHFRGRHPILQYRPDGSFVGVAYNQYKIVFPPHASPDFYLAFERFRALAHDEMNISRFLVPQDGIVIFDNRRVLHGRRPITDPRRHVIGCFLDDDDLRSTYRLLVEQLRDR